MVLGLIAGLLIGKVAFNEKTYGTLEIDITNPDVPYYRLLMSNEDFSKIPKKSIVMFKVNSKATFTQNKQWLWWDGTTQILERSQFMTEELRQNLEFEANRLADIASSENDPEKLEKIVRGTTSIAKTIAEIEEIEANVKRADEECLSNMVLNDSTNSRADSEAKLNKVKIIGDIALGTVKLLISIGATAALIALGTEQKKKETDEYVTTPKTNNLVFDGLKSIMRS